jgi:predicted DNA-binding transcriptional regulator YafY
VHSGRWYLAAFDHGRDDLRTFRVDRMDRARLIDGAAVEPPARFSAVEHVSRSLARVPWPWEVEVLLHLPLDDASRRIPATLAELVETPEGTLLRMRVSSLDWMASILAGLDCEFTIRAPDELRTSVAVLAARLVSAARDSGSGH